jgi:hypothetical protein
MEPFSHLLSLLGTVRDPRHAQGKMYLLPVTVEPTPTTMPLPRIAVRRPSRRAPKPNSGRWTPGSAGRPASPRSGKPACDGPVCYIPLPANLEYISSASGLEYGANPIRSKILSGLSPLLYPRTTCVCRSVFGVSSLAIPVSFFRFSKSIWINRFE